MNEEQINIACAELDGWKDNGAGYFHKNGEVRTIEGIASGDDNQEYVQPLPCYTTSYDAIVPLIQKQPLHVRRRIPYHLDMKPAELAKVLLQATNKWKE